MKYSKPLPVQVLYGVATIAAVVGITGLILSIMSRKGWLVYAFEIAIATALLGYLFDLLAQIEFNTRK